MREFERPPQDALEACVVRALDAADLSAGRHPAPTPDVRGDARNVAGALAAPSDVAPVLNHGNLAGSNVFWWDGRVVGVLDWDLASAEGRPGTSPPSPAGAGGKRWGRW